MLPDEELARLIDSRPTDCPNTFAAGCRCHEHDPGLLRYARDGDEFMAVVDKLRALRKAPARAAIGDELPPGCDGSMTCSCKKCTKERASIGAKGAGGAQFKVRPPRSRRTP